MNPLAKKSNGINIDDNRFAFGVATLPKYMAATFGDIVKMLRQRRIIASGQIITNLQRHSDPAKLLDMGAKINFTKGVLTQDILDQLIALVPENTNQKSKQTSEANLPFPCSTY